MQNLLPLIYDIMPSRNAPKRKAPPLSGRALIYFTISLLMRKLTRSYNFTCSVYKSHKVYACGNIVDIQLGTTV